MKLNIELPVSSFAAVNKEARLRYTINGRINRLIKQFHQEHHSDPGFKYALELEISNLNALIIQLDNNSVIHNTYQAVKQAWKVYPQTTKDHCIQLFGTFNKQKYQQNCKDKQKDRLLAAIIEQLKQCSIEGRKSELMKRLSIEMEERLSQGWYMVFNTLTVAPGHMANVFPKERIKNNVWQKYIRDTDRYFARAAYGSYRKARQKVKEGQDYHSYFAVVEKGSKHGRLHIHVLHLFKTLPDTVSDPNYGSIIPYNRDILDLKQFWYDGFSKPMAVRFSELDAYGKKGWRWPSVQNDLGKGEFSYNQLPAKPFIAMVRYVAKYLTKSYNSNDDKEVGCIWRTRTSRKLGTRKLTSILQKLPLKTRLTILQDQKIKLHLNQSRVPRLLMRRIIMTSLPYKVFTELYRRALQLPVKNILKQFRELIENPQIFTLPNFGNTLIRKSRLEGVFNVFQHTVSSHAIAGATYA